MVSKSIGGKPKQKQKQKELPGMPERTALGKKAMEFLNVKDEIEQGQENLSAIKEALVVEFKKADLKTITVAGHIVSYSHDEKDIVRSKDL